MNELLTFLEKFWAIVVPIAVGVASAYEWNRRRKATDKNREKESIQMLYTELEELKQKQINQVSREVDLVTAIAKKDKIIVMMKELCPDCHRQVIENLNS